MATLRLTANPSHHLSATNQRATPNWSQVSPSSRDEIRRILRDSTPQSSGIDRHSERSLEAQAQSVSERSLAGFGQQAPLCPLLDNGQSQPGNATNVMHPPRRPDAIAWRKPYTSVAPATISGHGDPLPNTLRSKFEERFEQDFSAVRLHTNHDAIESARALHARAFTTGNHIVFAQGEYSPQTHDGQKLLAHELTHVVQQRSLGPRIQRQPAEVDEFAPKGPVATARENVTNALLTASRKLTQAIKSRDRDGVLPQDVYRAYQRFFPGSDLEKMDLLKTRIDEARGWMQTMPIDVITNPPAAGQRDAPIHVAVLAMPGFHALAVQPAMPLPAALAAPVDHYIAIYPTWSGIGGMQTPILLHELFHFFPNVAHTLPPAPTEPPWSNARAYQGFVGAIAGLQEGAKLATMFPVPP